MSNRSSKTSAPNDLCSLACHLFDVFTMKELFTASSFSCLQLCCVLPWRLLDLFLDKLLRASGSGMNLLKLNIHLLFSLVFMACGIFTPLHFYVCMPHPTKSGLLSQSLTATVSVKRLNSVVCQLSHQKYLPLHHFLERQPWISHSF